MARSRLIDFTHYFLLKLILAGGVHADKKCVLLTRMDSAATLMGNPFSEPQGLNSVFSTDKSTLTVIAQANQKLAVIS
jgi:hypothetical protein